MTFAALIASPLARLAGSFAAGVFVTWLLLLRPAWNDLAVVREDLRGANAAAISATQRLVLAEAGRANANAAVLHQTQENARLSRELDAERANRTETVRTIVVRAEEEARNAQDPWSREPVDPASAWRVCVARADIAGVSRTACGSPPGTDGADGRAAGTVPGGTSGSERRPRRIGRSVRGGGAVQRRSRLRAADTGPGAPAAALPASAAARFAGVMRA